MNAKCSHGLRSRWARIWPVLLAVLTVSAVGGPAAVASYRHARDVIAANGDPVMAPWLALTTDGMLLAALVVIWVRRHRDEAAGLGPWAAFWAGMAATIAANLADAQRTAEGYVVALWPPVCLAITLELVALVATRTAAQQDSAPAESAEDEVDETPEGDRYPDLVAVDDHGVSRRWETAPPAGEPAGDRAGQLIAEGVGRRRLARELGIKEHEARQLLARHRVNGHATAGEAS